MLTTDELRQLEELLFRLRAEHHLSHDTAERASMLRKLVSRLLGRRRGKTPESVTA